MSPQRTFREGVGVPKPPDLAQKDTQKGKSNFRRHQEMARNTGRARRKNMRRGDRRTQLQPLGTGRGMGRRLRSAGVGSGMQTIDTDRGRKGTSEGRTPEADRDLGAGRGRKRGGKQTR